MHTPLDAKRLNQLRGVMTRPEVRPLLEYLSHRLSEADKALRNATGDDVYRCQGQAKLLEELIDDLTLASQPGEPKRSSVVRPVLYERGID